MDERLRKLHEMVDKGLDEITAKGSLDKETVCLAGQLVDIRKDLSTIEAMDEYGYSEDDGYSMARRRDSMGRYSRNSYRGSYDDGSYRGSYRGYSRDEGKQQMIDHLNRAMQSASNDHEREEIRRMIMQAER